MTCRQSSGNSCDDGMALSGMYAPVQNYGNSMQRACSSALASWQAQKTTHTWSVMHTYIRNVDMYTLQLLAVATGASRRLECIAIYLSSSWCLELRTAAAQQTMIHSFFPVSCTSRSNNEAIIMTSARLQHLRNTQPMSPQQCPDTPNNESSACSALIHPVSPQQW
jgi:hypothetical protein